MHVRHAPIVCYASNTMRMENNLLELDADTRAAIQLNLCHANYLCQLYCATVPCTHSHATTPVSMCNEHTLVLMNACVNDVPRVEFIIRPAQNAIKCDLWTHWSCALAIVAQQYCFSWAEIVMHTRIVFSCSVECAMYATCLRHRHGPQIKWGFGDFVLRMVGKDTIHPFSHRVRNRKRLARLNGYF